MKRLLLITLMALSAFVCLAQGTSEQEIKAAMNRIKLDREFLYGEATMPTLEESEEQARIYLMESIIEQNPEITVSPKSISVLSHRRLNMFRTLAYIKKDALDSSSSRILWTAEEIDSLTGALASASSLDEIISICGERLAMGELSLDTDDTLLRNSFVMVTRARKIIAMYTPADAEGLRTELKSGAKSRRMEYSQKDKLYYLGTKS